LAEQQATLLRANSAANVMRNELPNIHIKLFTGDYKEWPAFKYIFEHLTAIQKLHYLKTYITGEANICVKCNSKEHKIYASSKFDKLSIEQRRTFVKEKSLCFNCLKHGHV